MNYIQYIKLALLCTYYQEFNNLIVCRKKLLHIVSDLDFLERYLWADGKRSNSPWEACEESHHAFFLHLFLKMFSVERRETSTTFSAIRTAHCSVFLSDVLQFFLPRCHTTHQVKLPNHWQYSYSWRVAIIFSWHMEVHSVSSKQTTNYKPF